MDTHTRMGRVRHENTPIEKTLRSAVWRRGARFRVHPSGLPGRPDFVSVSRKVAVFVDGCFWHGCPKCYVAPKERAPFWRAKIEYNRRRRERVRLELRSLGWTVLEVWGHEIEGDIDAVVERVTLALTNPVTTAARRTIRGHRERVTERKV
jgi:DNA mismatch endonuclease, patch repair protein